MTCILIHAQCQRFVLARTFIMHDTDTCRHSGAYTTCARSYKKTCAQGLGIMYAEDQDIFSVTNMHNTTRTRSYKYSDALK